MDTPTIIAAIDDELEVLTRVRNVLSGHGAFSPPPTSEHPPRKRKLSAKARKAISDAQKRRWAKQKRASKAATRTRRSAPKKAAKKTAPKKEAPKAEAPAAS